MAHQLYVQHLSVYANKKKLLEDVSLHATSGNITALIGPNGAGKTTLIKNIMGVAPNPDEEAGKNAIIYNEILLNKRSITERAELGLVYLPQHTTLIQELTAWENLLIVKEYHHYWKTKSLESFSLTATKWLEDTLLLDIKDRKSSVLSGGQKRKLELVRAILMRPQIMILDEPFAGVDPKSIYEIKNLLLRLSHDGVGIIISDHHVEQLVSIADYGYVLFGGKVVCKGTMHEVINDPYTKELYLGTQFYEELAEKFRTNRSN